MYTPKISEQQIQELYLMRESLAKGGIKKPITILVREAIEEYLQKQRELRPIQS